jgi:hypothetical protein
MTEKEFNVVQEIMLINFNRRNNFMAITTKKPAQATKKDTTAPAKKAPAKKVTKTTKKVTKK